MLKTWKSALKKSNETSLVSTLYVLYTVYCKVNLILVQLYYPHNSIIKLLANSLELNQLSDEAL